MDCKMIEKYKKIDYEHSGRSLMAWENSAQALIRAAGHLLDAYKRNRATAGACHITAEGAPGWMDTYDSRLMPIYYMLIGYAVENYVKGIIIINHPEYLTEQGLTKIDKHETYDLLNENHITEFRKYRDILLQLRGYVISNGRYPIGKKADEHEIVSEAIDCDRLDDLLKDLYKRSRIERRLDFLRIKGNAITFQEFLGAQEEIVAFISSNVSMIDIRDQYPKYAKELIIQAMKNHAEDLKDEEKKKHLRMVIERWDLGYEEDKIRVCV